MLGDVEPIFGDVGSILGHLEICGIRVFVGVYASFQHVFHISALYHVARYFAQYPRLMHTQLATASTYKTWFDQSW